MRWFWRVLLLLALAAGGALLYQRLAADPGMLQLTWGGYVVETTAVVAVFGLLLALLLLALLLWLLRLPLRLLRRRRQRQARGRLAGGLLALHEGRWLRAEKQLVGAARERSLRLPALLKAAEAAEARGDHVRAQALLARAGDAGGETALLLVGVERLLAEGRPALACERLEAAAERGPLPPRGLELRLRALAACGRADEALGLLATLRKTQVLDAAAFDALEKDLAAQALRAARSGDELARRWDGLAKALRGHPSVVLAYASRAADHGLDDAAAAAIEQVHKRHWDERLALQYGQLAAAQPARRIRRAEEWLAAHGDSPGLLVTLGRLCRMEQLWGKSGDYLGRALAHGAGAAAWEELARLHVDRGDEARARQALENALASTRGAPVRALPGPTRAAPRPLDDPREERDEHGMPRLTGPQAL